jgi:hypothetical protein
MCATSQMMVAEWSNRLCLGIVPSGSWMMCRRSEYRISQRTKYIVTCLERRVEHNGRQSGSLRIVGEYDSAAEAERARMALQRGEGQPASEPADDGV